MHVTQARNARSARMGGHKSMLWTILIILLVLWALGYGVAGLGNIVHLLLVIALIVLVIQLLTGRRTVV